MRTLCRFNAVFLSCLLAAGSLLGAPAPRSTASSRQEETRKSALASLQLSVVEGEGGPQLPGSRSEKGLTVEAVNQEGAPLTGVAITFRLPDEGPSGRFADGTRSQVIYTGTDGRATVRNIQWNQTPGLVMVRVTAVKDIYHAGLLVEQTLEANAPAPIQAASQPVEPQKQLPHTEAIAATTVTPDPKNLPRPHVEIVNAAGEPVRTEVSPAPKKSNLKWIVLALVAAGAAGGVGIAAGGGGGKSQPSSPSSPSTSIGNPSISVGHP